MSLSQTAAIVADMAKWTFLVWLLPAVFVFVIVTIVIVITIVNIAKNNQNKKDESGENPGQVVDEPADSLKTSEPSKKKNVKVKCPHCGATYKTGGNDDCPYCGL